MTGHNTGGERKYTCYSEQSSFENKGKVVHIFIGWLWALISLWPVESTYGVISALCDGNLMSIIYATRFDALA